MHGIPATGWMEIDSYWYYFNEDGIMQSNCWIGNYYVKANGTMARSELVDGKYYVDENGVWDSPRYQNGFKKVTSGGIDTQMEVIPETIGSILMANGITLMN